MRTAQQAETKTKRAVKRTKRLRVTGDNSINVNKSYRYIKIVKNCICLILFIGITSIKQEVYAQEVEVENNRLEQELLNDNERQDKIYTNIDYFTYNFSLFDIGKKHDIVRKYIDLINIDLGTNFGSDIDKNKQHLYFINEEKDTVKGRIEFESEDIYLNDYYIEKLTVEEYLKTLAHEMYHFYEHNLIGDKEYFSRYTDYKDGYANYENCEPEISANRYADNFVKTVKNFSMNFNTVKIDNIEDLIET